MLTRFLFRIILLYFSSIYVLKKIFGTATQNLAIATQLQIWLAKVLRKMNFLNRALLSTIEMSYDTVAC